MDPARITFVILTKNEAENVRDCIASLPPGARALVYDAESTDPTVALARACGADVVIAPWRGVGPARDGALEAVATEWVFMLDADERVTPELRRDLEALEERADIDAYAIARANFFCGRWIRGAAWWPDRQVRLFRKGRARQTARDERANAAGHVYYEALGRTGHLSGHLIHHSYASIDDYRRRFRKYTDDEASARRASFGEFACAWAVMPLRAAWLLTARRGVLDGWRGVYVSVASALYPAVVATKAWRGTAGEARR